MARVNLERRAEIGLAKRSRTRAAILEAARACYAAPKAAPVTVDAVMQAAGTGEGHVLCALRRTLAALEAELGETLTEELDRRLQPARLAADHPLTRLATAVTVLLRDLARSPAQARLVARAATAIPDVVNAMQAHLRQDSGGRARSRSVGGVVGRTGRAHRDGHQPAGRAGSRRAPDRRRRAPDIVRAILRAIGCTPREAARHAEAAARHAAAHSQLAAGPMTARHFRGETHDH